MTPNFPALELPAGVQGRVYLASMPGRYEHLAPALTEMDRDTFIRRFADGATAGAPADALVDRP